jgi:parvulin-like peptidyl-prolyl isomerase
MTFRAKPVVNRPQRPSRDSQSRRNFYLNIGFGVAVVLAIVILIGVAVVGYYRAHLAAAATVNGQTITIDDFGERGAIEVWRLEQAIARVNAALAAGRLTSAEADQQVQSLSSQGGTEQLTPIVIERLIDARIQAGLATEEGITVTPEQIDAKIVEESTTPEQRHAWIIAVAPEIDDGKDEPTDAQKAAAKKIADQALADITSGAKTWEDVAKTVSTDSSKASGGDLGWLDKDAAEDEEYLAAIFAAEQDKPTAVLETEGGSYLIGRVTEIAQPAVDAAWTAKLTDAGIKLESYRKVVESEVIREVLEDNAIAAATTADKQRKVVEIAIQAPQTPPTEKAVKVRHILYSPKDDPQGAAELPADDPAWTEAQLGAQKAHDELVKDPSTFDERARDESDEAAAQGDTGTGGKLPYINDDGTFVQEFVDAVIKDEVKAGDILPPVKTDFGWHVIQVMYRPPDVDEARLLRDQIIGGADVATIARNFSDGNEAGKGGDKGWIAPGLLDARLIRAIYATPVGQVSDIVEVKNAGVFLYKVLEERTQTPDAEQLIALESRAFLNWYGEKKDAATVTRELLADLGLS